jgi:3-deoxy-D-manno-octulosonic-acid transferase
MLTDKAWSLRTYRAATRWLRPVAGHVLKHRLAQGKEDPARLDERLGIAAVDRPEGKLLWLHGASVGESLSILPLIGALADTYPDLSFLVTTGTVTSAELMEKRLPPQAVHQYVPLDQPHFVERFLDHWQPDAAFFLESELWPVMLGQASARGIPLALVNGRMSPKSFESWQGRKRAAKELLSVFDVLIAQNEENAARFGTLAEREVGTVGNLKHAADALPTPEAPMREIEGWIGDRPLWLAASTHAGEEEQVLAAHGRIIAELPRTLLVLAPRHPARGDDVASLCEAQGFEIARRSLKEPVTGATQVYLADTLGELGIFYGLSDIAFVGGSFPPVGGHNPLEPARLGCAILHGEKVFNFADTYAAMRRSGSAALVRNDRDLAAALLRLLKDEMTRQAMAKQAQDWAEGGARSVLDGIVEAITPVLRKAGIAD